MSKRYLIGNSHIDPVWLWNWQSGYTEVLSTFRSALDRMKEFPDFKYTSACAVYYQWVEKTDPEMFEEIKQRVKEGGWNIVGGWFLQPDCNIPSGESLARHSLYSQRYFKEKFGVTAQTGYNIDSFGHNAAIPKILNGSGMTNYVFMRPCETEKTINTNSFVWKSDDGSKVNAHRCQIQYNISCKRIENLTKLYNESVANDTDDMIFYGVGNHGGGPTVELINKIKEMNLSEAEFSTVDEYFNTAKKPIVVIDEELQHHARGCYSANTYVKSSNLKCEENLITAEKLSIMANKLANFKYPEKALKKAWKNVMFNQFHDILAGCCIKSAYTDASYLFGETMSITEQIINDAMHAISKNVNTGTPSYEMTKNDCEVWQWVHPNVGSPTVVFNPHSFKIKQQITLQYSADYITDDEGNEIPVQKTRAEFTNGNQKYSTTFVAEVEPFGYKTYHAFNTTEKIDEKINVIVTENSIENSLIKVEFNKRNGEIEKITYKTTGVEKTFNGFDNVILDETQCDTWAHDKTELGSVCGKFDNAEFKIGSQGAVYGELKVTTKCGNAKLVKTYKLLDGIADIFVKAEISDVEKHRAVKICIPAKNEVVCQIPYGTVTRKLQNGEDPFSNCLASDGLAVIFNGKYGYDSTENQIRVTALRTCAYADHFGVRDDEMDYMEQSTHVFNYCVTEFKSKSDMAKKSQLFLSPVRFVDDSFHLGTLKESYSGLNVVGDNVIVTAIKKSEDCDDAILRFYEVEGKDANVEVTLFGNKLNVDTEKNSINTVTESGKIVNLIEWEK